MEPDMRIIHHIEESRTSTDEYMGDLRSLLQGRVNPVRLAKFYRDLPFTMDLSESVLPYILGHLRISPNEDTLEAVDNMLDNFESYHNKRIRFPAITMVSMLQLFEVVADNSLDKGRVFLKVFGDYLRHVLESSMDGTFLGRLEINDMVASGVSQEISKLARSNRTGETQAHVEVRNNLERYLDPVILEVMRFMVKEKGEINFVRPPKRRKAMARILAPVVLEYMHELPEPDEEYGGVTSFSDDDDAFNEDLRDVFADMFFAALKV